MTQPAGVLRHGMVKVPSEIRERLQLADGDVLVFEETDQGFLLRSVEPEEYTPERIAEFLLTNSIDAEDYARNREEVSRMGLDPDRIAHLPPSS